MKKILIIGLCLLAVSGMAQKKQSGMFNYLFFDRMLGSGSDSLISPADTAGQFYYNNAANAVDPLDLMNQRSVEQYPFKTLDFDTTYTIIGTEKTGQTFWNQDDKTISVKLPDEGTFEVNQEIGNYYHNLSGVTLYNGDVVSVVGASGNRSAITLCNATDSTAINVIGMVTVDSILNNEVGRISTFGKVRGLNTNAYTEGSKIYVDPANPGKWTAIKPDAPNYLVCIGTVTVKNQNVGVVELNINSHYKLNDLSDVDGTALTTSGQIPVWNQDSSYFDFDYNINDFTTTDSLGYYVKQATATSVDNSLLKTVGTSGREVEQTGVTVSDGNIVSAPTFSATNLTDGYVPYHISDALGQGNSGVYWDNVNTRAIVSKIVGGTSTTSDLFLQTTTGIGATDADMHFLVGNNGATEAMTILNNGNVGIGTTAPTQKLMIQESGTSKEAIIRLIGTNSVDGASQVSHIVSYQPSGGGSQDAAMDLRVRKDVDAYASPSTIMTLRGSGNVGIGCTAPISKLSVLGQRTTNLNLFNYVNADINKLRTTFTNATDTSSVHLSSTSTGSPEFHIVGKTGNQLFLQDSAKTVMGSTTNNTSFESDGSMLMTGTATVFDDLFFPFETGETAGTGYPTFVADSSYYTFVVDTVAGAKCIKYFTIQLPHCWKEGSTIFPHVHYKHETAVGTPKFIMKYKWYNTGESTAFGWNWYKMEATTGTDNNTVQMSYNSSNGILGSGKTISSILICQIYLSGVPTNVNAYQFDIHIEMDRLGSRTETSK